jgi:hypothetical protein
MPRKNPFVTKKLDLELESEIEIPASDFAERCGWVSRKLSWFGRKDAPDRFYARRGRILLIEYKRPGEKPRGTQADEIALLREAGVEVHVIDNLEAAYALFY